MHLQYHRWAKHIRPLIVCTTILYYRFGRVCLSVGESVSNFVHEVRMR